MGVRLTSNCWASTSCFSRVPGGYSPVAILAWIRLARSSISFGEAAVFKTILPFFDETSRKADSAAKQAGAVHLSSNTSTVFRAPNTTSRKLTLDLTIFGYNNIYLGCKNLPGDSHDH